MSENERRLVDSTRTPTALPPGLSGPEGLAEPSRDGAQNARSRRRRRPADAENQGKNQMFYFVDSSSSSKEKRAHVMRHHVQEKKKQRKLSHGAMQADQIRESLAWSRKDSGYDTDNRKDAVLMGAQGLSVGRNSPLPIRFSNVKPYFEPTMPIQIGSPMTMLDASRQDPFSSLPIAHNPEDLELVDYWTTKLTYWSGQNSHLKNQIFRTAMQHPLSFQAVILAYCARWKAQLYGIPDSKEVQRRVGQVRKHIEDATTGSTQVPADQLVMALAGMALGEERFGSRPDGQAYLDQAVRLMRSRTGLNMGVDVFLQYVRFIIPPQSTTIDPVDRRRLVTFLRNAEDLMRRHSRPEYHTQTPQRRDAFQMESPLFPLLSSGPRPSQVPHASRMYVVRDPQTQEVSRTAALIFVTTALWDFKDSTNKTGRFLAYLRAVVEQHQLDRQPACETLLWLLLEQGCEPDLRDPERAWSTGEMLRTHRQLRPDLQFLFNEILMSFLTLRSPIRGIDVFEEELRASISSSSHN